MNDLHPTLEQYYSQLKQSKKLHIIQRIVNFYFWFKELDPKFEPYGRYVRAAQRISKWSSNETKVLTAIAEIGGYFSDRDLEWTLDTVYRNIPRYTSGLFDTEEAAELRRADKEIAEESERRLAEFRAEKAAEEKKLRRQS